MEKIDGSPDKQTFDVQIAGLPLKLRSSHDEKTVLELIHLVDEKVKQAMDSSSSISFQKALLLAALHFAEDLVFLKKAAQQELGHLESKAKAILNDLESSPVPRIRLDV